MRSLGEVLVLLSEYVPAAVNCWVCPTVMNGFTGVTTIDCSGFLFTMSVVELVTKPRVAVMVTVPNCRAVARPALVIDTSVESEEVQVTRAVKSCVLLSLSFLSP